MPGDPDLLSSQGCWGEVMVNSTTQETFRSTVTLGESLSLLGLSYIICKMGTTTSVLPTQLSLVRMRTRRAPKEA